MQRGKHVEDLEKETSMLIYLNKTTTCCELNEATAESLLRYSLDTDLKVLI